MLKRQIIVDEDLIEGVSCLINRGILSVIVLKVVSIIFFK
jgi:hypothetical protein